MDKISRKMSAMRCGAVWCGGEGRGGEGRGEVCEWQCIESYRIVSYVDDSIKQRFEALYKHK